MTERVLLTGCGDLGRRVAQSLLARGDQVWALRRHPPEHDSSGIQWLRGDLSQPASLHALPVGINRLVHTPAPDGRNEAAYRAVFSDGLRHVLGALDHGELRRVVLISSSAIYGNHAGEWVNEDTPTQPTNFNGRVLLETEQWLATQTLSSACLRLAGIYGPGRLQLLERLRAGQACAPLEPPHWANRIHIDDAAAAVLHLLHLPAVLPVYLGCDDTPLPLHELYAHLAALIGAAPPPIGPAPAGVGSKKLSNARLRASGLQLQWPDARSGYAALLAAAPAA